MGRKRSRAADSKKLGGMNADAETEELIEAALGHDDQVCQACSVRNPADAEKCRKCGHTNLRPKAKEYRNG